MKSVRLRRKPTPALQPETPCAIAGRAIIRERMRVVLKLLPLAARQADEDVEPVHQLRVATRRADAAVRLFAPFCSLKRAREVRRALREVRRAAAAARQDDVHLARFEQEQGLAPEALQPAYACIVEATRASRRAAQKRIRAAAARPQRRKLIRRTKRLLAELDYHRARKRNADRSLPATLRDLSLVELPPRIEAVRSHPADDLRELATLHQLRILGKRLRYSLELLQPCLPERFRRDLYPRLQTFQDQLGDLNDLHEIALRLTELRPKESEPAPPDDADERECAASAEAGSNGAPAAPLARLESDGSASYKPSQAQARAADPAAHAHSDGLQRLADSYVEQRDRKHRAFVQWWRSHAAAELFDELSLLVVAEYGHPAPDAGGRDAVGECGGGENAADEVSRMAEPESTPAAASPTGPQPAQPADDLSDDYRRRHPRIAAIDVGTNSIRLVVAEADALNGYRIIQDLKETTRLGSHLASSGRLDPAAVERSLAAIERMKAVAEGYHVAHLRAVGTSAVREAENGDEFVALIRKRAGVEIEPIDADTEARLAFSSVANAFDLSDARAAVVDIGGGSTELVFSSDGMIDAVHTVPLGAVRLTEMFRDDDEPGRYRFGEMTRAIDRMIEDRIDLPAHRPDRLIGTGGTFTTLARISIRRGMAESGSDRFPFAVRGYELQHREVALLLDWLRRMPLEKRRTVPGLSSQRAEVIVAGVCIVDRLMKLLGVSRLLVHDGGIRDGLLFDMIDGLGMHAELPLRGESFVLDAVRRFAQRCRYEKEHSEHVAKLAVRIYDQLVEQIGGVAGWSRRESRVLLHAAAVLHDIGVLIAWKGHHKHSYNMIVHADLPMLTRREIEIIANIGRYHRRAGPCQKHRNFLKLSDDDQRLVAHLAGILRIADGLDRLHTQNVTDVAVEAAEQAVQFQIAAEEEPAVNIKYADRKADMFESAFHLRTRYAWVPAAAAQTQELSPA